MQELKEVKKKTAGYLAAAFGFVAGLAWNEAIKSLIEELFPLGTNSLIAKFFYAFLVTVILVLVSGYVIKYLERE